MKKKILLTLLPFLFMVTPVQAKQHLGPKPEKWCGYYMRSLLGGGPEYNLARNWVFIPSYFSYI